MKGFGLLLVFLLVEEFVTVQKQRPDHREHSEKGH